MLAISAAVALAELGDSEGAQHLMKLSRRPTQLDSLQQEISIFRGLSRYLQKRETIEDEIREDLLGLLEGRLNQPTLRTYCFRILSRLASTDFGYLEAGRLPSASRLKARAQALQDARAWLEKQRRDR